VPPAKYGEVGGVAWSERHIVKSSLLVEEKQVKVGGQVTNERTQHRGGKVLSGGNDREKCGVGSGTRGREDSRLFECG